MVKIEPKNELGLDDLKPKIEVKPDGLDLGDDFRPKFEAKPEVSKIKGEGSSATDAADSEDGQALKSEGVKPSPDGEDSLLPDFDSDSFKVRQMPSICLVCFAG